MILHPGRSVNLKDFQQFVSEAYLKSEAIELKRHTCVTNECGKRPESNDNEEICIRLCGLSYQLAYRELKSYYYLLPIFPPYQCQPNIMQS
jgi:hypothetical protein